MVHFPIDWKVKAIYLIWQQGWNERDISKLRCKYKYRTIGESGEFPMDQIFLNQFNGFFWEILETLWITMKEVDSKE